MANHGKRKLAITALERFSHSGHILNMTNRIREIRLSRKLTLEKLAEKLCVDPRTVQRFETGERNVSLKWIEKIADALDVSPQELISGSNAERADQGIDEAMFKQAVTYAAESLRGHAVDAKEFMGHVFKIYGRIKADPSFVSDESRLSHIKTGIDTALAMLESAAPAPPKPEKTTRN